MTITILNGNMNPGSSVFSDYVEDLETKLKEHHNVHAFPLIEMDLNYCTGCWSCWWKTPGECAIKDDAEKIFRSVINSDFLIFASPLMVGFTSSVLKKITDRLIVLLHPYIEIVNGECHHRKRYDSYPDFGLLLQKEDHTDEEDIQIISDIYDRLALNFHARKKYIKFTDLDEIDEIIYETTTH